MDKPFSQACENNKGPILSILNRVLADKTRVLEIGSGTGQHAVYFGAQLRHLVWQTSDQDSYHDGIRCWLAEAQLANVLPPISLTIGRGNFPASDYDAVYSANTAHIMQRADVVLLMQQVSDLLPAGGVFCQYGPFTENGAHSSQSNEDFDRSLRARGYGGYRDISELKKWSKALVLEEVNRMPANNLLLVWRKLPGQ